MAGIMLVASNGISAVPGEVQTWIEEYVKQNHTFIVGDRKTSDAVIHRTLSGAGASDNTLIYCMNEPASNVYEFKTKKFITEYNADEKTATIKYNDGNGDTVVDTISGIEKEMDIQYNRHWIEFIDRKMIEDCSIGIFIISEPSKRIETMLQIMNIYEKPCYVFRV